MQIAFAAPQGTPGPAPLVRTLLTAAQVYGRDGGQAGALRVAAALHLAAATSGPVGPHSMEAARLAQALEQEDVGWQAYCAQLGTADLNQQIKHLLEGAPGFLLIPLFVGGVATQALRLDAFTLARAAASSLAGQAEPAPLSPAALCAAVAHRHALAAPSASTAGQAEVAFAGPTAGAGVAVVGSVAQAGAAEAGPSASPAPVQKAAPQRPAEITNKGAPSGAGTSPTVPNIDSQQVKHWAFAAIPGPSDLAVTARLVVQILFPSWDAHGGLHSLKTSFVGSAMVHQKRGNVKVRDVVSAFPNFFHEIHMPPAQSVPQLKLNALREAAESAPPPTENEYYDRDHVTPHPNAHNTHHTAHHESRSWLLPRIHPPIYKAIDTPHRVMKLAAVRYLLSVPSHFQQGPHFGSKMAQYNSEQWNELPQLKRLLALCQGDKYLEYYVPPAGQAGVRLNMAAFKRDAKTKGVTEADFRQLNADHTGNGYSDEPVSPTIGYGGSSLSSPARYERRSLPPAASPAVSHARSDFDLDLDSCDPETLRTLAERVYTEDEPNRACKVHAVYVLASQMESKADMSPVMTGAAFGQPMSKALHQAWGAIPGSKVKVLCQRDPYLVLSNLEHGVGIRLNVKALQEAARKMLG